MALTTEDVASLARLARIELTEAELEVLAPPAGRDLRICRPSIRGCGTGHSADLARTPVDQRVP